MNDLKEMFERYFLIVIFYRERKERELKEEEIVESLREISARIQD